MNSTIYHKHDSKIVIRTQKNTSNEFSYLKLKLFLRIFAKQNSNFRNSKIKTNLTIRRRQTEKKSNCTNFRDVFEKIRK